MADVSVACLACNLPQHDMAPMGVEDMIGFLNGALPAAKNGGVVTFI